jgi:PilZ domain
MAKRKKDALGIAPPSVPEALLSRSKARKSNRVTKEAKLVKAVELISDPVPFQPERCSESENRTAVRRSLRVPTVVQFRDTQENTWKEVTQITTVSKNGAGLILSRECPVGRLISLVMQMPTDLRLYDHYAPVYPMLGVVQNCTPATVDGKSVYHVGVAFIGKKVPSAAKADPKQCYRIVSQSKDGLWNVVESPNEFQSRKHSRLWRRFEVTISLRDHEKRTSRREQVFTRDVSLGGMAVWGPLDANIGDRVKVSSKDHDFYSMALVRNRTDHEQDETKSLVHFEFDGAEFPMSKIVMEPQRTASAEPTNEASAAEPSEQYAIAPSSAESNEVVRY